MKKLITLLLCIWIISSIAIGQHAFIVEYPSGIFDKIDLTNAIKTNIGTTQSWLSASDFGPNNFLYAINANTNEFIKVDTTDGSTTLFGTNPPPTNHIWTGMAYDDATGVMYGVSSWGIAAGECSLHTIDVTNGSYTLVGTQTDASAIACIAIDDAGQMYGVQCAANGKVYLIDKADGSVTFLGLSGVGVAGMGQGLDYCSENQTMYMTNYNSLSWENTLRTVNLTNGSTTSVGDIGIWTGTIAVAPQSSEGTVINLNSGYQFISSNIIPDDPDMIQVLSDILNDNLDFVRDSEGSVLRKIGPIWVNGIGDWVTTEGYLVKMNSSDSFEMFGDIIDPQTPIDLLIGYQFISYLPTDSMDALIAFNDILENIDFVRDSNGNMLRKIGPTWVNGIGDLNPKEGYLVKMNDADNLIYPE